MIAFRKARGARGAGHRWIGADEAAPGPWVVRLLDEAANEAA
jgi:hypothetical protein